MSPDDPGTRRGLSPGPAQHLHGGQAEVGHLDSIVSSGWSLNLTYEYEYLFLLLLPMNNVLK